MRSDSIGSTPRASWDKTIKAKGVGSAAKRGQADGAVREDQKLRQACRDMEALFLGLLLNRMRSTVPKAGLLDTTQEEMMRPLLDRELTSTMAQAGGIGLADMLYRQLANENKEKSQAPR
ncbi:rod-binding protein [Sporolituus thermophilus]|uniref:Flagellar protein FlgJ n=1 Tax=Sporolituus thermophilus DSM 23256 TaxID=1123285 RepID=A0A1G7HG45_9FIRM|nr:rod-binding protein [Sporolituus thermophilus]SDE99331.1 flagellar protein FlgJ [Sporolituus thermophilus DSM 23256]